MDVIEVDKYASKSKPTVNIPQTPSTKSGPTSALNVKLLILNCGPIVGGQTLKLIPEFLSNLP